jgi:hypothetical protein
VSTIARFDKYEPMSGGFRAPLAAAYAGSDLPVGIGLDVNGRVVVGAGNTGIKAVVCIPDARNAGDIVDCMVDGDIVDFAGVAGTNYRVVDATGVVEAGVAGAGQTYVGHTVEATRLVVHVAR